MKMFVKFMAGLLVLFSRQSREHEKSQKAHEARLRYITGEGN